MEGDGGEGGPRGVGAHIHTIDYLISIHCRVSVFASCGYSVSELGAIR